MVSEVFFPENPTVPDGFEFIDFTAGDIGVCWVYGSDKDIDIYRKHEECFSKMYEMSFDVITYFLFLN